MFKTKSWEKNKKNIINRYIQGSIIVFPSQLMVRYAARALSAELQAVDMRRLISWDRFKEQMFNLDNTTRPVNTAVRLAFAHELLHRDNPPPFNRLLPKHSFQRNAYRKVLARMLSQLYGIDIAHVISDSILRADLQLLKDEYSRFLDQQGYYEPLQLSPDLKAQGRSVLLVYPRLLTDFLQFQRLLEQTSEISFLHMDSTAMPKMEIFQSEGEEIDYMFSLIQQDFDAGYTEDQIIIALADPSYGEKVEYEARVRGIQLDSRIGTTLDRSREGAWLLDLLQVSGNPDIETMVRVLDKSRILLKDPEKVQDLIGHLREWNGRGSWNEHGRRFDQLEAIAAKEPRLLGFYKTIRSVFNLLDRSRDYPALQKNLQKAFSILLDKENIPPESAFQSCLELLKTIQKTAYETGISLPVEGSVVQDFFSSKMYLTRGSHRGIQMHNYAVAAGLPAVKVYVLGAHESVIDMSTPLPSLIPEYLIQNVEDDLSKDYLAAHGESFVSMARTVQGRAVQVPGLMLQAGVSEHPGHMMRQNRELRDAEQRKSFECFFPAGEKSLHRALLQSRDIETNYVTGKYDNDLPESFYRKTESGEIKLRISPSSLDRFLGCPHQWFLEKVWGLGELRNSFEDSMMEGNLYHRFFEFVYDSTGRKTYTAEFYKRHTISYWVDSFFQELENSKKERDLKLLLPAYREKLRFILAAGLEALFKLEMKRAETFKTISLESEYSKEFEYWLLHGRVDRISSFDDSVVCIDYKRSKSISINSKNGTGPATFQFQAYFELLKEKVDKVDAFEIRDKKFTSKIDVSKAKDVSLFLDQLAEAMEFMYERVSQKDFSIEEGGCTGCAYRSVCRVNISIGRRQ
jgi:CRISPR/Cas system-associated exonuclease Cas4 (RecB family)